MRIAHCSLLVFALISPACTSSHSPADCAPALDPAAAARVTSSVRDFMTRVAAGVTANGPSAWRTFFVDTPEFFMAAEGRLVFGSPEAAHSGIEALTHQIKRIDLRWGTDLRIQPLTPALAVIAVPYYETLYDHAGGKVDATGYFTGLVERGPDGWRIRNAHWSPLTAPGTVP
ncbi:MAG TPA: hypothetical protein VEZ11_15940 [Thermoanaerobaculia bacterium]|nr:hypothetical protein [Thermoanaerobaculia bacterium]